ncbi:type II secretion system F family protein [Candidatus Nomurabacteria bacterium]|nr:type II secretion system F family protein [Candidatus Nomurabacteria bacterium]
MLFNYKAVTKENQAQEGSIDAPGLELAISSLQRRGLIILDIKAADERGRGFLSRYFIFSRKPKMKDVVLLSRQIATMFEAKVSALATFRLLASEVESPVLKRALTEIADEINSGVLISTAMTKQEEVFSPFYVSMVKSGEESGKLSEAFNYLAAYLERSHGLVSKAKNALIYPAFIILSFIVVMILMLVFVIPKLSAILKETGQAIPIYTRAVIGLSQFFVDYGFFLLAGLVVLSVFVGRWLRTDSGRRSLSSFKLSIPYVGNLYQKLYLSRISDNLSTMLTSGISMVRALEITSEVVDNDVYKEIMLKSAESVKNGNQVSAVMSKYHEVPSILVQMFRVGEETGKLGSILETIARFYQREVYDAVDTLVDLIEPAMIVLLGAGVGILLTSVLVPIYNLASGI